MEELARTTDVSRQLDPGGPDELGRLRRAFNRLLVALDASRESQRQLVLDASHELRTPLTSLRTNMEVARQVEKLAPEDRDVLVERRPHPAGRADLSGGGHGRAGPGRHAPDHQGTLRFDELVVGAVEAATTHGRSRGVTFVTSSAPWISGSASRIERAVNNLLDNAVKYSPDGSVVEVVCGEGAVVVRDHGPGVAERDIERIFDRFYRAPEARSRPGLGPGTRHRGPGGHDEGGQVSVHHAPGGGALFRLGLPAVTAPASLGHRHLRLSPYPARGPGPLASNAQVD